MLEVKEIIKTAERRREEFIMEYRRMDFYGPFLSFKVKKNNKTGKIDIYPKTVRYETAELSCTDFDILVEAMSEVYEQFGNFTLHLEILNVEIVSGDSNEISDAITARFKQMRLF